MAEHHGPTPEQLAELQGMFGPTGKFPAGKLNADDEGELIFGIRREGEVVRLDFGKPVAWLGLPADVAEKLGHALLREAKAIRDAD